MKKQKRKIKEIFKLFDHDSDGYISSTEIDISTVSTNVLECFSPILIEMEEQQISLNFTEFYKLGR